MFLHYWGLHMWTQHSRWGLSRAQRGKITFLDKLITFLLMQPRIWLFFGVAKAHWRLMSSFSTTSNHKSFLAGFCKSFLAGFCKMNLFISQLVLIVDVAATQVQDLALGLVKPHEVHLDLLLKPFWVPLDNILSLGHVDHTPQLRVIHRIAGCALNLTVDVID